MIRVTIQRQEAASSTASSSRHVTTSVDHPKGNSWAINQDHLHIYKTPIASFTTADEIAAHAAGTWLSVELVEV